MMPKIGRSRRCAIVAACIALPCLGLLVDPSALDAAPGVREFLRADGEFDLAKAREAGYTGQLTAEGLDLSLDRTGAPVFAVQPGSFRLDANGDADWQPEFGPSGVDGAGVLVVGLFDGDLILGGTFVQLLRLPLASNIVRWDGTRWYPLGKGLGGSGASVLALAEYDGDLVVGGAFTTAQQAGAPSPITANRLVRWNGTSWETFSNEPNGAVRALHVFGGDLYVGGSFTQVGGMAANRIAKWNATGNTWSALGSTVSGGGVGGAGPVVNALQEFGSALYVGGGFSTADGSAVSQQGGFGNIATWSGSAWNPVGDGVNGTVNALTTYGSSLVVGGSFSQAKGAAPASAITANNVATWSAGWSTLGSGFAASVQGLAVHGGELYAAGSFTLSGGGYGLARYDSATSGWVRVGTLDPDASTSCLGSHDSKLIVGGAFTAIGSGASSHFAGVARWDGSGWSGFGQGVAYDSSPSTVPVLAMTADGDDLIVGGKFTTVANVAAGRVAKWNGSGWSTYGGGLGSDVRSLAVYSSAPVAGGIFSSPNLLARWTGSSWDAISGGTTTGTSVNALLVDGGDLIVAGAFTQICGTMAANIAKWNGSSWSAYAGSDTLLASAAGSEVRALAMYQGSLHIVATAASKARVYKWTGSSWQFLGACKDGSSEGGNPLALASFDDKLVLGGDSFSHVARANTLTASTRIAAWDGSAWSSLGLNGFDGPVRALVPYHCDLVALGDFNNHGFSPSTPVPMRAVGRWDGTAWAAMASTAPYGPDGPVWAGTTIEDQLFVGGNFVWVGDKPSVYLGRYTESYTPFDAVSPLELDAGKTTIVIAWETPGPSNTTCAVESFDLRVSNSAITSGNFNSATPVTTGAPGEIGTPHCANLFDMPSCAWRYFGIKTMDSGGRYSALTTGSVKTKCTGSQEQICSEEGRPAGGDGEGELDTEIALSALPAEGDESKVRLELAVGSVLLGEPLSLVIYDVTGRRVRGLMQEQARGGTQSVLWDNSRDGGRRAAPGVYFARLTVGARASVQRVIIRK